MCGGLLFRMGENVSTLLEEREAKQRSAAIDRELAIDRKLTSDFSIMLVGK